MEAASVHQRSAGKTWSQVCLTDGRRLVVTKDLQGVEVSQVGPRPAPQERVWRRDYAAGHAVQAAYRRIVMLLTAGRSIAQVAAHEDLPEVLRANRVASAAADLCHAVLGAAFAAVRALQKDPLNVGSLGSDPQTFTVEGAAAAFEQIAFLNDATGRVALAILGSMARDELMEALGDAIVAEFTRALYGRRSGGVECERVADLVAGRLADRGAEYASCAGADRPEGGPGGALLWEVGTRTAVLLGRTNEIAFIDDEDARLTACLDGLQLAGRLRPLREPDGEGSHAIPGDPHHDPRRDCGDRCPG